jgi:hypothetical protein
MKTPSANSSEKLKSGTVTRKPATAGILMIVAGITAIGAEIIYFTSGDLGIFAGVPFVESSANLKGGLFATGLIAIVGGICTLQRRIFWLIMK